MSVYVGIDVHRRRSQVAVVTEDRTVQLNKNTVNGTEPILRLIGNRPAGVRPSRGHRAGDLERCRRRGRFGGPACCPVRDGEAARLPLGVCWALNAPGDQQESGSPRTREPS